MTGMMVNTTRPCVGQAMTTNATQGTAMPASTAPRSPNIFTTRLGRNACASVWHTPKVPCGCHAGRNGGV